MIDFPGPPLTVGQQFTAAGVTWTWDGTKWTSGGQSVAYLPLAGGTMLGPIVLAADPAAALQAATKQYVDGGRLGDNRVINGDMRIDQRNNGASGTAAAYTVDRWAYNASVASKGTWQRLTPGPTGFPYYLSFTSSSAYASAAGDYFFFRQPIEADMVSDFAWGTPNAQPVTLSFWVAASVTGTFSGCVTNYASNRSYPFTFSISAASTWTKIVLTIPGDTAGTWSLSGNSGGLYLYFDLGSGATGRGPANAWAGASYYGATSAVSIVATNGAQFGLTGVKLEIGSIATPFNRQSLAKSLADCQRYFYSDTQFTIGFNSWAANAFLNYCLTFPATMRAIPTIQLGSQSGATNFASPSAAQTSATHFALQINAIAAGGCAVTFAGFTASAEL